VKKYPKNFMLGSDAVGSAGSIGDELREFDVLLDELDPKTRELVARENFRNLMGQMAELRRTAKLNAPSGDGIALPADYMFPEYAHIGRLRDDESFVRSRLEKIDSETKQADAETGAK
jgi:hypothetical protein